MIEAKKKAPREPCPAQRPEEDRRRGHLLSHLNAFGGLAPRGAWERPA